MRGMQPKPLPAIFRGWQCQASKNGIANHDHRPSIADIYRTAGHGHLWSGDSHNVSDDNCRGERRPGRQSSVDPAVLSAEAGTLSGALNYCPAHQE